MKGIRFNCFGRPIAGESVGGVKIPWLLVSYRTLAKDARGVLLGIQNLCASFNSARTE